MSKKNKKKSYKEVAIIILFIFIGMLIEYSSNNIQGYTDENLTEKSSIEVSYNLNEIPEYDSNPYVIINENKPNFSEKDFTKESFEKYAELDILGRCGVAYANVCKEIMPKYGEEREDISSVRPTGWKQKKYNGEFLYNRCHLIGYQLSNENDNNKNLITGTRYFNVSGMLPFENKVAEYIKSQGKNEDRHVLYRVTPIYEGNNLLAKGVQMEAYSIEDNGESICFNVFVYNVQPGIIIDYATGSSKLEGE